MAENKKRAQKSDSRMDRDDRCASDDATPKEATSDSHPIVWINLLGCGSARRPTIKVPAVRADLVAGSAYFAAMLDGPYRESTQTDAEPIAIEIPPLRDAVFVATTRRGRRRRGATPCPAERLCSLFVRILTEDGRPAEACDILLLWRALCFVGASPTVMKTCARTVHDAMGLLRVVGDTDRLPDDTVSCTAPFARDRRVKRMRLGAHANDVHIDVDVAVSDAMPPIAVVAYLYALLGGPIAPPGGIDGDDDDDGTVRDFVADALLPDPWARFALDWSRASRGRATAYMRFGQQVIQDCRGTLCGALWCASAGHSVRALIAMMRDWASALWPAERLGFVTTSVNAFEHRLANAALPGATPALFASAVIKRFPVFGPVFFNVTAESALGVFNRLPQGVVLAGGCAIYALCRASLVAPRHRFDAERPAGGGDEPVGAEHTDGMTDDAERYICRAAQRAVARCGSVPPGDMDLFIVGASDNARRKAMSSALATIMEAVPDCRAAVGSSVITLWTPRSPDERLQLVFTNKTRAEAVPAGFDMTHLGVACSRDTGVVVSWGALHALITGATCATPGRVVEPYRASKAHDRGFTLVEVVSQEQQQQQQQQQHCHEDDMDLATGGGARRTYDYVAYTDAKAILAAFAYGQVINDNYCADQPRTHHRRSVERTTEPLGDAQLNLMRVTFATGGRYGAVDRAPPTTVICPTICSVQAATVREARRLHTMRLTIRLPCSYGVVSPTAMTVVSLRRAEVDLVRRAAEAHASPWGLAVLHGWCGGEYGLTLDDACAAVLAGIAPVWWTSALIRSPTDTRDGKAHAYTLCVHVAPESHLSDGVTGRRITLEEACAMGDAAVAASVIMGSVVCDQDDAGPFFTVATLVAAAFYPPGVPAILDALKSARA
ncbi:hypothetical protein pneo_cds_23 [Pandoravirus neocaledonia]|uniref:Uncharacterized protein n=1 Tax=Pandoravirus neocaledonia TaxID=2107708 RepID=A0A2U7UBC3_9VIRU|nr:hypothetical protein pneo_cds_23 [Pandoravirus neocaledonia]AVK75630.1 hypothetical protein pneo_cds_23 [Pandoravirus neocaledonia]